MVTFEQLKEMCLAPGNDKAYFRPLISSGDLASARIFFVGTNPATPIYPKDMDIDSYVNLLLDYPRFMELYKALRLEDGKDEISRTRTGMNSFLGWLRLQTNSAVVETEVIPYPTAKLKQLKKEPKKIIERGRNMFLSLVLDLQPSLIILHGKKTVEHATKVFLKSGLIKPGAINLDEPIEVMETRSPLFDFTYKSGQRASIVACRHFMYYGSKGESFEGFRKNVQDIILGQGSFII